MAFVGLLSVFMFFVFLLLVCISLYKRDGKTKKHLIALGVCFMVFVVVIVATPESEVSELVVSGNDGESVVASAEPEPVQQEYKVGDMVKLGNYMITVTDFSISSGSEFNRPKKGNEYIIVTVKIENDADSNVSYNPLDFKIKNSNGQITEKTYISIDKDTALSYGELAPGGYVTGTVTFEQPKDDPDLDLIFEPNFWSSNNVTINLN